MKVINLHDESRAWIELAIVGDRKGQKAIYDNYVGKLLAISRRYIDDDFAAEDVTMACFVKIFRSIESYDGRGSFEAWISRIAVFESISYLRSQKKYQMIAPLDENLVGLQETTSGESIYDDEELQWMIDQLPSGCKTVFLMYAIDGYKHHEIAEALSISEGTSKSQLSYARKQLKDLMNQSATLTYGR